MTLDVSDRAVVKKLWDHVPSDLRNVDVLGEPPRGNKYSISLDLL